MLATLDYLTQLPLEWGLTNVAPSFDMRAGACTIGYAVAAQGFRFSKLEAKDAEYSVREDEPWEVVGFDALAYNTLVSYFRPAANYVVSELVFPWTPGVTPDNPAPVAPGVQPVMVNALHIIEPLCFVEWDWNMLARKSLVVPSANIGVGNLRLTSELSLLAVNGAGFKPQRMLADNNAVGIVRGILRRNKRADLVQPPPEPVVPPAQDSGDGVPGSVRPGAALNE
jgi:hypothetical protein